MVPRRLACRVKWPGREWLGRDAGDAGLKVEEDVDVCSQAGWGGRVLRQRHSCDGNPDPEQTDRWTER